MSIFEYDKEKEEKKLRKAEYEAGWKDGQSVGWQEGQNFGWDKGWYEGENVGQSKGLLQGIIMMGRKCNLSDQEIIRELQESLACDEAEAEEYLRVK